MKELGEMVSGEGISKSGINHRLRKIDEIAEKLLGGELGKSKKKNKRIKGEETGAMVQKQVEVALKNGLASTSGCVVCTRGEFVFMLIFFIEKDGKTSQREEYNGDLMSLAIGSGSSVTIITEGSDAEAALEALAAYVQINSKTAIAHAIAVLL